MRAVRIVTVVGALALVFGVAFASAAPVAMSQDTDVFATVFARQTATAKAGGGTQSDEDLTPTPTPATGDGQGDEDRPRGIPSSAAAATVVDHVDGDKIKISRFGGAPEEVLLLGLDAPEIDEGPQGECYAREAADHLAELLPNDAVVYLESDQTDKDSKKRLLRYVWFDDGGDGVMANEIMLREGYGSFQARDKDTLHDAEFSPAQDEAKAKEAGLWGACGENHVKIVPPTPTPELGEKGLPAPVGTTLTGGGVAVTLDSAYTTYQYGSSLAKGGYVFLVMQVSVTNVDDNDNHRYSDTQFDAEDIDTGADFKEPQRPNEGGLEEGDLSPGEYASGIVGLEIQETSSNVRVHYGTAFFGGDNLYWLVQL